MQTRTTTFDRLASAPYASLTTFRRNGTAVPTPMWFAIYEPSVVWDAHGTQCGVCLKIAAQTVQLKQEGKSNLEIRHFIDDMYNKGYAKPTDTAMPTA